MSANRCAAPSDSDHRRGAAFIIRLVAVRAALEQSPAERRVVAHFRLGDWWPGQTWDCRGVFRTHPAPVIWHYVRECLPKHAYVLGDHEEVFRELADSFQHPPWRAVGHSWNTVQSELDELRMWADWMTIRRARVAIVVWSGFSTSALLFASPSTRAVTLQLPPDNTTCDTLLDAGGWS